MILIKKSRIHKAVKTADRKGGFALLQIRSLDISFSVLNNEKHPDIQMPKMFEKEEKREVEGCEYSFFLPKGVTLEK